MTTNSIGALAVFVGGAALAYFTQLVVARVLGPDSFGLFAYVMACTTLLGYFCTLGLHVSLLRFLTAYRTRGQWSLANGVVRYTEGCVAMVGVAVGSIGALLVYALGQRLTPEHFGAYLLGLAAVPVIALHLVSASAVRAFGGVLSALIPERIVRDGVLLTAVVFFSWTAWGPADGRLAMTAALLGAIATLVLLRYFMHRMQPAELRSGAVETARAEWRRPAPALMVIMIADNIMCRSGIIILGMSGHTREAGIFAVAHSLALLTTLPRMAVASAFAPTVSALHARGDSAGMQRISAKASALSLLGTLLAVATMLLAVGFLLAWFGQEFKAGASLVWILALGHVFSAACGPQQHLITMTGNEKSAAQIFAAAAILNVAGCIALIGPFGMIGAAVAMSLSLVTWNIAMAVCVYSKLGLKPGLLALVLKKHSNPV